MRHCWLWLVRTEERNLEHLRQWIPEHVRTPSPLPDLEERLAGWAADFEADRAWRFAVLLAGSGELAGEASLFARSSEQRVPRALADRVEIGYWLREDLTSRGYATEAAQALVGIGSDLPGIGSVEIRCDSRNAARVAVPRRLGFALRASPSAHGSTDMVWYRAMAGH